MTRRCIVRRLFGFSARFAVLVSSLAPFPGGVVLGQGKGEEPASTPEDDGKPPEVKEREKRISGLFTATQVTFEKDKIVLVYNFESRNQDLTSDWLPALTPNSQRIRWPRAGEGTYVTIEDGIMIGDFGEWVHSATFLGDVEVEVELMPVSPHKAGNIMAAVFYNEKKKRAIGTNAGSQVVCLAARKFVKPPIPKTERVVSANERHKIGFVFDGKKLECRMNGRKQADTLAVPKFTEGFETGRVGLMWNGSVQYFIFNVKIHGKLDPAWVASKLGESKAKGKDSAETKKDAKSKTADKTDADKKDAGKKQQGAKQNPPQ